MCYQTDPKFRKSVTKPPVLYRVLAVQIRFRSNPLRILKILETKFIIDLVHPFL